MNGMRALLRIGCFVLVAAPMAFAPACGGSDQRKPGPVTGGDAGLDRIVIHVDASGWDWGSSDLDGTGGQGGAAGAGGKVGSGGKAGAGGKTGSGGKGSGGAWPDAGSASGLLPGVALHALTAAERQQLCEWTMALPTTTTATACPDGTTLKPSMAADAGVSFCEGRVPISLLCPLQVVDWEQCFGTYSCMIRQPVTCSFTTYCTLI